MAVTTRANLLLSLMIAKTVSICVASKMVTFKIKPQNKMLTLDINELQANHKTTKPILQHLIQN
jgi:hypothetical protein